MKKILLGIIPFILIGCSMAPNIESNYSNSEVEETTEPITLKETSEMFDKVYELEFSEEFDSLNKVYDNWSFLNEDFGESKARNGYHIWAKEENFEIEDGSLKLNINVDKQAKTLNGATLMSNQRFLLKDTVWEIKFKVDKSTAGDWFVFLISPKHNPKGSLANNWYYSLPNNKELREITPIELVSKKNNFRSALYLFDTQTQRGRPLNEKTVNTNNSFYEEWHTLKFCWEEESYSCFLDDTLVYKVWKDETIKNIPENDLYGGIYLGADMMGEWHGAINPNMPAHSYMVDYVKVWREVK